ncbi:MAG: DUF1156 domain-containing protein [Candidatus Hydrogenedentes bacterium]|nr:DUF1156 domain-containing protein [Candidatus Hydrogenedentota bacterium]
MDQRRLIEEWMPIAYLSEECIRERRSMTALPPTYYLHVWWARRPLVASRAAILGALLPPDADHEKFLHVLGIHGDPVAAKKRMAAAGKNVDAETGKRENLGTNPYGYGRAFKYVPLKTDLESLGYSGNALAVLDPTAGGGSIPFEAMRLGCGTYANDLNPVAWLILKATVEFPAKFGAELLARYEKLTQHFIERASERFEGIFPREAAGTTVDGYLWARTVKCPYCGGIVPLSPNWRLSSDGTGVRLVPRVEGQGPGEEGRGPGVEGRGGRVVDFEIVKAVKDQSPGTVSGGNGSCPFPDCGRVIDGDEIKAQAQSGRMGEQLYAIVYKEETVTGYTKAGNPKIKKVRGFRAPRPEDDVREQVQAALDAKLPEWQARNIIPDEEVIEGNKTTEPIRYGMKFWRDLFSPRQLYGHCVSVEVFQELVEECGGAGNLSELDKAALTYLALAVDKIISYNGILCRWDVVRVAIRGKFDRHDFAFQWSYGEMAPTITGLGYDWAVEQTGKSLKELIELTGGSAAPAASEPDLFSSPSAPGPRHSSPLPHIVITNGSGDQLPHIADASVDAVVMDPPYYDNVMYAELADFFYVWLKRTAGLLYPEPFSNYLTDKDREAVANVAKFKDFTQVKGTGGAKKRAGRDYQERMQAIFAECRRVLKPDGVMVLMFTHKATGAWDALARGLLDAGFTITASWPINTEAEGSLHIKDKNAAKSTIFLVCRPRNAEGRGSRVEGEEAKITYWEEVEPKVIETIRGGEGKKGKVAEFQAYGIRGVDLYLSCFGPALQVFSEHWPMQRGRAMQRPEPARGAQLKLVEDEEWDPYAVRPEDALMAARRAVKDWRMEQLATVKRQAHLDPVTEFFILAWDAFESPEFPADEALKLARVVGVSFDQDLKDKILEVKSGDVVLWDSAMRAKKGTIGAPKHDLLLNALHHAARAGREQNTGVAKDLLEKAELTEEPAFLMALEAILNVLPAPALVSSSSGPLASAAADADALEKLRKLAFAKEVPAPKQLGLL